jgi:hypothetical protein
MSHTKPLLLAKFTELILFYKLKVELTQCALFVFLSLWKRSKPATSLGDSITVQGGSDKSGIFFFLLSNDAAQLKIIRFD